MNIYQLKFDYGYALADIVESLHGADSLDFCAERPELIDSFKYGWITDDSEVIPDFVVIMCNVLGCKLNISKKVKELLPNLNLYPAKIETAEYVLFVNLPILSDCLNLKKSKITRFSTGDIMEISSPVFLPGDYPILFKMDEMPSSYFCTQEFKDMVEAQSYKGLLFEECKIKSESWF